MEQQPKGEQNIDIDDTHDSVNPHPDGLSGFHGRVREDPHPDIDGLTQWPKSGLTEGYLDGFTTVIMRPPRGLKVPGLPYPIPDHDEPPPQGSNSSIHFPDGPEATHCYWGLPSVPIFLARSAINSTWEEPCGPEAYSKIKEIRPMQKHALHDVWEGNLAFKIHDVLDLHGVQWTSTDIACFGWKDDDPLHGRKKSPSFLVLWIGVMEPEGFNGLNAEQKAEYVRGVAQVIPECLKLLRQYGIDDVDVEIRHSTVALCGQLQAPLPSDPVPDERHPFTTAIGHTICSKDNMKSHGTGGFFVTAKGDPHRLLLVTARHVVFPEEDNRYFESIDASQSRHDVVL
ncbi:hypothetical protein NLI96_g6102 [Meripilus lineatus]|uniref:Uncharacterized protein n=1 Tax=Meripilus lineatus TaxID=2056292 RepID=A0AAD5V3I6_9APHY|nr:hypothetical protein NLI96_g6102 [Physisporinus lineatus]